MAVTLGGPDGCVRDRRSERRHPAPGAQRRHDGPGQRQSLRGLLQPELGPGHVGDAGRDVPQPDPRLGLAVSGAAQWTANFLISVSFPVLAKLIGLPITYGFYTACAFISIVFVLKMVHETRGRELEDMVG